MPPRPETLRAAIAGSRASLLGRRQTVPLSALGRALDADLSGRNVLLRTSDQLFAALGLIELDGVAARIVLVPPDVKPEHLPAVIERAQVELVVSDDPALAVEGAGFAQERMGVVHLGHDRHPQDGGAQPGGADRRHPARHARWRRVWHLLRYPPLWRLADSVAGAAGPSFADPV